MFIQPLPCRYFHLVYTLFLTQIIYLILTVKHAQDTVWPVRLLLFNNGCQQQNKHNARTDKMDRQTDTYTDLLRRNDDTNKLIGVQTETDRQTKRNR